MTLVMYHGDECFHCNQMLPLVEKLEKEEKAKVVKKETWHNSKNNEEFKKIDNGKCGGVPFFWNTETKKFICGAVPYAQLKKWALGK